MRLFKKIENYNDPGWDTVLGIYSVENLRSSLCIPITLSIIILAICLYSGKPSTLYIGYVSNAILLVVPAILGFTLSGYALMMGLSNSEFIKGLARFKEEGKNYSMFQSLNATFAVVLLVAFITTIAGICGDIILKANISFPVSSKYLCQLYNWTCFLILLFFLFYTVNAIKDVVINVFNFGQYVQAYIDSESNSEDIGKME